jgi:leucyl aminopeptidase
MLGIFENSLALTNYENSHKKQPEKEDNKEPEEDEDDRKARVSKRIESIRVHTEKQEVHDSKANNFWRVSSKATETARNLANTRGSVATPCFMEDAIKKMVSSHPNKDKVKELRVLDAKQLQDLGMNLFYNVGKGAVSQPRCVIVHYLGNPSAPDTVDFALVGKGITFDTGGLNLKPSGFMEDMYGDKGGSCAVIGALEGTLTLGSNKNIIFACGFAENAIGSRAYKPGDIIKGMNGLSVEIGNTDAEGRLVLADTFTYV